NPSRIPKKLSNLIDKADKDAFREKSQIIIVPRNSDLSIINKLTKSDSQIIFVEQNSTVDYLIHCSDNPNINSSCTVFLEKNASLNLYWYGRTTKQLNMSIAIHNLGIRTESNIYALLDAGKSSRAQLKLTNNHIAPRTKGNITCKALVHDKACIEIPGWINVERTARATNSYLTEKVLLLSPEGKAIADPNLEILNHDVMASHSATVGQLPKALMYYLTSRGLSNAAAEQLLIKGFITNLVEQMPNPIIREIFNSIIKK
ncbi:SufD family Fe-S cluster assembly protein, partial [Patescibacteria group bacterium]|nr:SufD family Fe-S cluster assembly protein [Patescibacteria group bacterium]